MGRGCFRQHSTSDVRRLIAKLVPPARELSQYTKRPPRFVLERPLLSFKNETLCDRSRMGETTVKVLTFVLYHESPTYQALYAGDYTLDSCWVKYFWASFSIQGNSRCKDTGLI